MRENTFTQEITQLFDQITDATRIIHQSEKRIMEKTIAWIDELRPGEMFQLLYDQAFFFITFEDGEDPHQSWHSRTDNQATIPKGTIMMFLGAEWFGKGEHENQQLYIAKWLIGEELHWLVCACADYIYMGYRFPTESVISLRDKIEEGAK